MHDELTKIDIQKMRDELDHRLLVLKPQLLEEVKRTRAFGDLSENYEYKTAKREKNENDSRIRYLEGMIKTAIVIDDRSRKDEVGLFDKVEFYLPEDDECETVQIVTTVRLNVLEGRISKESPLGRALLGRKVGDRVFVGLEGDEGYYVEIRSIEKGRDDASIPLNRY